MALHKEQAHLGVDAGGQQHGGGLAGLTAQGRGLLAHGQRVQVSHHVKALEILLQAAPVAHRADVVAQGEGARGLDAGKNTLFAFCLFTH